MICPECSCPIHRTVFTRQNADDKIMRRKRCTACGTGWYTVEVILPPGAVIHTLDANKRRGLNLAKDHRNILFQ